MRSAGEVSSNVLPNTEPCHRRLMELERNDPGENFRIPFEQRVVAAPQECVELANTFYSDGFATEDEDRAFFRMFSSIHDSRFTYATLYIRADHLSRAIITRARAAENWTVASFADWDHRCSVFERVTHELYPNATFGCYDGSSDIITYPDIIPQNRFDFTHSLSLITRRCYMEDYFVRNGSIPVFTAIQWWRGR